MLDEETKKWIADYVLDQHNPERLNLLVKMRESWETIRLRVIKNFCEQIVRALSDTLPASNGWLMDAEELLTKFTYLGVRREKWDEGLYVGISAESWGWIIGVWGKKGYHHASLPGVLVEGWGLGKKTETWPWYHNFADHSEFGRPERGNWRTGSAILELREGAAGDYRKRLSGRIVEIAKTVDGLF